MSLAKLNTPLYRWRGVFSVLLLLIIGYFVVYSWMFLPSLGLFLGWHPDTQLVVLSTIEEQYQPFVQPGDIVLSIDGVLVRRGERTFPSTVKPVYELSLLRGNEIVTETIPIGVSRLFRMWELSKMLLATLIWVLGFLMTWYADTNQTQAVIAGFSFQLIAAGIVSPGPSQLGAPGGWLVGQVLVFYFPLIMLYLGFIPRYSPWPPSGRILLKISFIGLTGLALAAAVEQLFLYPDTSIGDLIGLRSQTILTLVTGVSLITSVVTLLVRMLQLPRKSYERQQVTLLCLMLILALTPLFFFVIVPVDQTILFAPFPFIYSFLLLIPVGYFFVFHRQGYLQLDRMMSQVITTAVLIIAIVLAYTTGVYLYGAIFQVNLGTISEGILVLVLFGVAITSQRPVKSYVDILIYGQDLPEAESLQEMRAMLSTNPEPATVVKVVDQIAHYFQVRETAVFVIKEGEFVRIDRRLPSFSLAVPTSMPGIYLRTRANHDLHGFPEWVSLVIPIQARGEFLGLFLLSNPANGYFNSRQVRLLQDFADILALSMLVISLVEVISAEDQSAMLKWEQWRQQIATEIHNGPLNLLTSLMIQLQLDPVTQVELTVKTVRQAAKDLRRIISGLRPPILKDGVAWIARQIVRDFDQSHPDIKVSLHLEIGEDRQATEPIKMAFYYVLTEALNNVSRHARATQVDVSVRNDDRELSLTVTDNGVGPGGAIKPFTQLLREQHLGVSDMHYWSSIGGGSLVIAENQMGGTRLVLTLPPMVGPENNAI